MIVLSAAAEWCLHQGPIVSVLTWQLSVCDRYKLSRWTFSIYLISSKEQSRHGKFNHLLFSVIAIFSCSICQRTLPQSFAHEHKSTQLLSQMHQHFPSAWVEDAVQFLFPPVCCTGEGKCRNGEAIHSAVQAGLCFYNWLVLLCHCISH